MAKRTKNTRISKPPEQDDPTEASSFYTSKRFRMMAIATAILASVLIFFYVPFTSTELRTETVPYTTETTQDSNLELGQKNTIQAGSNGTDEIKVSVKHTLFGKKIEETEVSRNTKTAPVTERIAQGTRRYQYMNCSNGTYRYYSNDEFKDPNVGFTHSSEDFCAKNGQGHMTGISDYASSRSSYSAGSNNTSSTYRPTYTPPAYRAPTSCYTTYHDYSSLNLDSTASTTCY